MAFTRLYGRHRAFVRQVLRRMRVAAAAQDDVEQEVFLAVFRGLHRFRGEAGLRTWIFSIAVRKAHDHHRSAGRMNALEEEPASLAPDPEQEARVSEGARVLERCLAQLDDQKWLVFCLAEIEGLSGPEIAERTGLPVNTVYTRLHRARKAFDRAVARERAGGRVPFWAVFAVPLERWQQRSAAAFGAVHALAVLLALAVLALGLAWAVGRSSESTEASSRGAPQRSVEVVKPFGVATAAERMNLPRATLTGRVQGTVAGALAGATVCLWDQVLQPGLWTEPACAQTDEAGMFRIEDVMPGPKVVTAGAPGFLPLEPPAGERAVVVRLGPAEIRDGLVLNLEPGGARVAGVVRDISGGVVPGARVVGYGSQYPSADIQHEAGVVARADELGRFELWLRPGEAALWAEADGYAHTAVPAAAPSSTNDLRLTPESVIRGHVLDAKGGPVEGVTVTVWGSMTTREAVTDTSGAFRIEKLEPGRYKPHARGAGGAGSVDGSVVLGLAETSDPVEIRLRPTLTVRGRVLRADTGDRCERGSVRLANVTRREVGRGGEVADDGTVRIHGVEPGVYRLDVSCSGQAPLVLPDPVTVDAGWAAEIHEWTVQPGLSIRGTVVGTEGPIAAAEVRAHPLDHAPGGIYFREASLASHDGTFQVGGLTPGRYEVSASPRHDHQPSAPVVVTVGTEDVSDLVVQVQTRGRLRIRVTDAGGDPIAGLRVPVQSMARGPFYRGVTGDDGVALVESMAPGEYAVAARTNDENQLAAPGGGDPAFVRVTVEPGQTTEATLAVELPNQVIRGRVVDRDGGPVGDAFVDATLLPPGSDPASLGRYMRDNMRWTRNRDAVLTDVDGGFVLRGREKGTHLVRAYQRGGEDGFGVADGSGDEVVVEIVPTATVAGRVFFPGAQHGPVTVTHGPVDGFGGATETFAGSGFRLEGVQAGELKIHASTTDASGATTVVVQPGEDLEGVDIRLVGLGEVTGRIVDLETGEPVPGVQVRVSDATGTTAYTAYDGVDPGMITDAEGRYHIRGAEAGVLLLSMRMPSEDTSQYRFGETLVRVRSGETSSLPDIGLPRVRVALDAPRGQGGLDVRPPHIDVEPHEARIRVAGVQPGGPADRAGLKEGDEIVSIDGVDVSGFHTYRMYALTSVPPGHTLAFGLADGREVAVEMR